MPEHNTSSGARGGASPLCYGPAREEDVAALARIMRLAFSGTNESLMPWIRFAGVENLRVVRERADGPAIATLGRVPMGQHFGGRSVPLLGVAGVGTAPEARGRGAARLLMESCVREAASEGTALVGLYASTQALYRQSGFEQGGFCFQIQIPVKELSGVSREAGSGRGGLEVVALPEWSKERERWVPPTEVRDVYTAFARRFDGMLDRSGYGWSRVRQWRDDHYEGFGVRGPEGRLEGYVYFLLQRGHANGRHDVMVSDAAFTTARAARRVCTLLGDLATMAEFVILRQAGPIHPLLTLLPLQAYKVERREYWMTRIALVERAVEARGWPSGLDAEIDLDVRDELVTQNAGSWRLGVKDGRGTMTRRGGATGGGTGAKERIACDIGGLVPMYTGLYSARQAALIGLIEGSEEAIERASVVFPGGQPWMADFF